MSSVPQPLRDWTVEEFDPHWPEFAPLARLEAQIGFRMLLDQFPEMQVAELGPVWGRNTILRGLAALPVRF